MNIKNKIAVVTGASGGIGEALAIELTNRGASVVLAARDQEKLKQVSEKLPGSIVIPTDMTKESDIKNLLTKTIAHFGKIDILINNAGQGYEASIEKIDPDIYRKVIDLNVIGPLVAMQQAIPLMRDNGGGYIVNISSGTALMAIPHLAGYSSTKRALVGLSLTAHEELKSDQIKVSVVYPYMTSTDFMKNTISDHKREWSGGASMRPADSAEYVAKLVCDGIVNEELEIYAHSLPVTAPRR